MPLINQALPNLIGGVSQQPDVTRFEGQCEAQENALSSVVDGLSKRPQSKYVAELLSSAISSNSFVNFIDRSETERYVYIQDGQDVHIFNTITGERCVVGTPLEELYDTFLIFSVPVNKWDTSLTATENRDALTFPTYYNATETQKINGDLYDIGTVTPTSGNAYLQLMAFSRVSNTKYISRINNTQSDGGYLKVDANGALSETGTWKSGTVASDGTISVSSVTYGTGNYPVRTATPFVHEYNTESKTDFLSSASHYLRQSNNPKASIKAKSIGDTTLLLNTTVTVAKNSTPTESISKDLVLFIKQGDYQKKYGFSYKGATTVNNVNATSGNANNAANAGSETILNQVADAIFAGKTNLIAQGWNAKSIGYTNPSGTMSTTNAADVLKLSTNLNVIALKNDTYTDFIAPIDDLSGLGMGIVYSAVSSITDLPLVCLNGMKIKVKGDTESGADDYYAEFVADNIADKGFSELLGTSSYSALVSNIGKGSWVETVGEAPSSGLDNTTMPYSLINNNVNQFLLLPTSFATLQAGDLDTNPHPSFVGNTISNIFFFKGRLGFLSQDKVIMSEAGLGSLNPRNRMSYNFYRTTVSTSLDSDPIDVTVASTKVTTLTSAVGFQENLVLFANNAQFVLKGGDLLTARSVSITPITNFESDVTVEPVPLGSYIYFPFTRGTFSGIREFTVNSTTDNYDASEITEHVPAFLSNNITSLIGGSAEDIMFATVSDELNVLYVYKYFWSGTKKLLSSWSKFILPFNIEGINMFHSELGIVGVKESKTHYITLPLQSGLKDTGMNYNTYLDMRKEHTLSNATTVPLGFTASVGDRVQVWDDEGQVLNDTLLQDVATSITLATAHTGKVFSGLVYTMKYVFSEQVFKQQAGNSKAPSGFTRAQIRNGAVFFNDTRGFKVKVQPDNRDETTHTFTPTFIGTSSIGNIALESGNFRFPVFTDAQGTTITIENDSALPANFSSAEFETFVHERSKRFG